MDLDEIQDLDLNKVVEHKVRQAYEILQTPVLFFNPALPYRTSVLQNIPIINNVHNHLMQIVIGNQDDVILAKDNLDFIMKLLPLKNDFRLHLINELGHGIPVAIFESELNLFFR